MSENASTLRVPKAKKSKKKRASSRLFGTLQREKHRGNSDADVVSNSNVELLISAPESSIGRNRKNYARSQSFVDSPEIRRLEHMTTQLSLDILSNVDDNPNLLNSSGGGASKFNRKAKRRGSSEMGMVITGQEIVQWLTSTHPNFTRENIEQSAQSLVETGMLVPIKHGITSNKFLVTDNYIISYPLFNPDSVTTITGMLTPFIDSSEIIFTAKNFSRNDVIIRKRNKLTFLPQNSNSTNNTNQQTANRQLQIESHLLSRLPSKKQGLISICQTSSSNIIIQEHVDSYCLLSKVIMDYEKITENIILHIIIEVAEILESMHQLGYAYGSLNLNSIYIHRYETITETSKIFLIDTCNIQKIGSSISSKTQTINLFTPPEYLSSHDPKVYLTSDLWSLGICLYWLLYGFSPFICSDLTNLYSIMQNSPVFSFGSKQNYEISPSLRVILLRLLNNDPDRRLTASELISWPRDDLMFAKSCNKKLCYSFVSRWRSFQYIRLKYDPTIDQTGSSNVNTSSNSVSSSNSNSNKRTSFRSKLFGGSSSSNSNSNNNNENYPSNDSMRRFSQPLNSPTSMVSPKSPSSTSLLSSNSSTIVDIGICSSTQKLTDTIIQDVQKPIDIDNYELFNSFTIENITTRLFKINVNLEKEKRFWESFYSSLTHIYFLVDLKILEKYTNTVNNLPVTADVFKEQIQVFEKLYLNPYFYDRIRAPIYNIPITIVFLNSKYAKAIWDQSYKLFSFPRVNSDSFESVFEGLEALFVSIKNRKPVPRNVKSISILGCDKKDVIEVFSSHSKSHSTRSELKDADSIIKRVIKLNLKRVHINFPFFLSKTKSISCISNLSVLLCNTSVSQIQDINFSNLGLTEKDLYVNPGENSLFYALSKNTSITSLNLSSNLIQDYGIIILCNSLVQNKENKIQTLILSNTKFTSIGAKKIASSIQYLRHLKTLDISRNEICDDGIISISECLFSNKSLKSLYLEDCNILDGGFISLCELLKIHPLKYLNLNANMIPNNFIDNLLKSIEKSLLFVKRTIILPKFTEHRILRFSLNKQIKLIETHKKASKQFEDKNPKPSSLSSSSSNKELILPFIQSINQPYEDELNYSYCNLSQFYFPIDNNKLKSSIVPGAILILNLNNNNFQSFPDEILHCTQLIQLSLANNQIKSIGNVTKLITLQKISFYNNKLQNISGFGKLKKLRFIDLRFNQLKSITSSIEDIENLEELLLDGNQLLKIEFCILSLRKIKNLSVRENLIPQCKVMLYEAWSRDYRICDMSFLNMNHLPKEIFLLRFIVELNLSFNLLESIPPQLGKLSTLKVLNLSNNQLNNENCLVPLLFLDLCFISLVNNDQLPSSYTSSSLTPSQFKQLILSQKECLSDQIEMHRAKLMIVGKSGVGKTTISKFLRIPQGKQRKKFISSISNGKNNDFSSEYQPTDGIDIHEWKIEESHHSSHKKTTQEQINISQQPIILSVWDMSGADVYKTTHAFFLEERSIFILSFNLSIHESKQDVLYWLQMITASAPQSPILLVGTHAELVNAEDIQSVGNAMIQKYSSKFPTITNFISICTFNSLDIDTLQDSIINVLKSQNYYTKKVSSGYNSLISLIESERQLCNPPFISMREFEFMIMNCDIAGSSQTIADYLNLLGVISYFNDRKLGISTSIVLDPSWLISLISTIITSRDNGIRDGVLYHSYLPTLWMNYPSSLYPFLIELFNKIELLFTAKDNPDPEKGLYSLIPSTFSTQKLGAQSKFIPIDDYLALGLGTQLERIYEFDFLPFGFFSRLVVRLLHFTSPSFYWRTGLVCNSGENSGLIEFEMGRELSVKVRGRNPAKLLRVIVENIDLLLSGWYKNNVNVIVPFILKGNTNTENKNIYQKVGLDYKFTLEELEAAAAFGKTEIEFNAGKNDIIPIRIDSIAPDLVMADISEMLMTWDELKIEKKIGEGAFGKVYSAEYKGQRVAVKQIEVEQNMKTEAYREFRREVALCSELQQPAIVSLRGVCLDPWSLALEFMPYGDLYTFLKDTDKNKLTWKMRITICSNIAEAVRFLHSFQPKIIHRDLKSPNCLMASIDPNADYIVKVTDFGESRAVATSYTGRDRLHNPGNYLLFLFHYLLLFFLKFLTILFLYI